MTLEEAIKHAEEVAEEKESEAQDLEYSKLDWKYEANKCSECAKEHRQLAEWLKELKQLREQTRWISISERSPKDLTPVNITLVNHNPKSYYVDIKDKPFTATGVYFNGQWYHNHDDIMNDSIEITAWMPLPEPMKVGEENC